MQPTNTPFWNQYLTLRKSTEADVLLVHLGEFYEAFNEDAQCVHETTGATLTSRQINSNKDKAQMCGTPERNLDVLIAQLLQAGYSVAIAEPIGNEPINGLLPREIVATRKPKDKSTLLERQDIQRDIMFFIRDYNKRGVKPTFYVIVENLDLYTEAEIKANVDALVRDYKIGVEDNGYVFDEVAAHMRVIGAGQAYDESAPVVEDIPAEKPDPIFAHTNTSPETHDAEILHTLVKKGVDPSYYALALKKSETFVLSDPDGEDPDETFTFEYTAAPPVSEICRATAYIKAPGTPDTTNPHPALASLYASRTALSVSYLDTFSSPVAQKHVEKALLELQAAIETLGGH